MTLRDKLASRQVAVAIISFATALRLRPYQEMQQWPFPIFADPERKAYQAFSLGRIPLWKILMPGVIWKYLVLIAKGFRVRGTQGDDIYQGGGDFLVLPTGQVVYAHRSDDPTDRPTLADLEQALEQITVDGVFRPTH